MVTLTGDAITTTDGPLVEIKELVGSYAVYEVPDLVAAEFAGAASLTDNERERSLLLRRARRASG